MSAFRLFTITGGTVTLDHLTIQNDKVATTGGTLAPPACLEAGTWDCESWGN